MAKKIGIIVLLCFSLCVGGVSAFADEGHDETDTQTLIETQPPVSSVLFRQDGADIQQSTDEGKTWQSYSPIEETDYFTYDEFSAWIENETENIQKLVDAGEWTEAEATEALEYYDEILKSILEGKMVGKRASSSDDQLFFSMPDNAQPEQYQTFVFDGNTYKSIGPFDTEEELFNALKEYTDISGARPATRRSIPSTVTMGSNTRPVCMSRRRRSFWIVWSCSSTCGTPSTLCRRCRVSGWRRI